VDNCAACHGDFGEGAGAWPVIVGGTGTLTRERPEKTVESYWPYLSTAWDYVYRSMPFGAAQTLEVDEVYAIVAYILYSGGLVEDDFELSHENFRDVRLPNEGGFYEDDRDALEVPLFTQDPCMSDCRTAPVVSFRATALNVTPIELPPARIPGWDSAEAAPMTDAPVANNAEGVVEALVVEAPITLAAADPALIAEGERAWRACAACHRVGVGARHGTGPELNGVMGMQAGTAEGFRYSPQMVAAGEAGLIWTAETMDAFLANPAQVVPRNRMSFRGVRSDTERAALIAYIASHSD
jgi:S-disulfanyl-L-cysteine oxidoreductase SoxD